MSSYVLLDKLKNAAPSAPPLHRTAGLRGCYLRHWYTNSEDLVSYSPPPPTYQYMQTRFSASSTLTNGSNKLILKTDIVSNTLSLLNFLLQYGKSLFV